MQPTPAYDVTTPILVSHLIPYQPAQNVLPPYPIILLPSFILKSSYSVHLFTSSFPQSSYFFLSSWSSILQSLYSVQLRLLFFSPLFFSFSTCYRTLYSSSHWVKWSPRKHCIYWATLCCVVIIARHVGGFHARFRFGLPLATRSGVLISFFAHPFAALHFIWCRSGFLCALVSSTWCRFSYLHLWLARQQLLPMSVRHFWCHFTEIHMSHS